MQQLQVSTAHLFGTISSRTKPKSMTAWLPLHRLRLKVVEPRPITWQLVPGSDLTITAHMSNFKAICNRNFKDFPRKSLETPTDCQRLTCWPGKSYPATATSMPLDLPQSLKSFEARFVYVMSTPFTGRNFGRAVKILYSATFYSPRVHPTSSTIIPN